MIMNAMIVGFIFLGLYIMDKSIYPGCTVVDQKEDILFIRLSDQLASGSDSACQAAGVLINKICKDGYRVQVVNSSLKNIGIIDLEHSEILAYGY